MKSPGNNRSVRARNIAGGTIVTGDHNIVTATTGQATLPPAEPVDLKAELTALRALMATLVVPERAKLDRALDDAMDEVSKPNPDKEELGGALERAIKTAKSAAKFAETVVEMQGPVVKLAVWLGPIGAKLLGLLGLAI